MHIDHGSVPYTPYFCEENIWWLARKQIDNGLPPAALHVLFFSNANQSALMLNQKSAAPGQPLAWDYHVVLLVVDDDGSWIMDPDSRLPSPTPAGTYMARSFPQQALLPASYRTLVRIIPADRYCERFYSDRSHMLGCLPAESFPHYPMIRPAQDAKPITLAEYRNFSAALDDGSRIVPLGELDVDSA